MEFSVGLNNKKSVFGTLLRQFEESGELALERAKLDVVKQIVKTMEQEGVNKAELARRLGASRAYISQFLQGDVNFTIESIVRIAAALDSVVECKFVPKASANLWLRGDDYYRVRNDDIEVVAEPRPTVTEDANISDYIARAG